VLKPGVTSEIDETLSALGLVEDTKHLVDQLAPMLKREVDFTQEAKSFDVLRSTPIGRAGDVNVPVVRVATPHFLARTAAPGEPLSVLQRGQGLDEAQRRRLYSLQVSMVRAALETDPRRVGATGKPETYVLTDPHGGNVAFDGTKPGLFDPGQFETLTKPEADFFVWSLATFSNPSWHSTRRAKFVERFAEICTLKDPNDKGPPLQQRLNKAFEATLAEPHADVGRKLQLLLIDASKRGIAVPNGYFGLAKMLHSIESQAKDFKLRSAVNDVVSSLYVDQLGPAGRLFNVARGVVTKPPNPLLP
jgi:predicted unusual protein kinase regulating ubiquinone biosynthesis (AarF/ABC1/UbiB family)